MWILSVVGSLIYSVLNLLSSIVYPFCIFLLVCYIWDALKNRTPFSKWADQINTYAKTYLGNFRIPLLAFSLLGILITTPAVHQLAGIHDLDLKPEGTYCFYVEAQQHNGDAYVLPAQIDVVKEKIEVDEGRSKTRTYYYIENVYFSNGGYLDASDGENDAIGQPSVFFDGENYWELTLLNEHAYSPYVQETDNADWLDIVFLLLKIIPTSILLCMLYHKANSQHTADEPI